DQVLDEGVAADLLAEAPDEFVGLEPVALVSAFSRLVVEDVGRVGVLRAEALPDVSHYHIGVGGDRLVGFAFAVVTALCLDILGDDVFERWAGQAVGA